MTTTEAEAMHSAAVHLQALDAKRALAWHLEPTTKALAVTLASGSSITIWPAGNAYVEGVDGGYIAATFVDVGSAETAALFRELHRSIIGRMVTRADDFVAELAQLSHRTRQAAS